MIGSAWRCELPLWKTFWLLHWLGTGVVAVTVFGIMLLLAIIFYPTPIESYVFEMTACTTIAAAMLWNWVSMCLVWVNASNTPHSIWRVLAQLYVFVNVTYAVFELVFALWLK